MKLVRLLRPLFLVALALHGLALFLPLGGASETAEEEAAEETIVAGDETLAAPGQLPVPDLNVATTGTANNAAPLPASAIASVLSPAAVRQPSPVAQPSVAARSAPLAMAVPTASASRATPGRGASRVGGSLPSGVLATPLDAAEIDNPERESVNSSPPLDLPVLPGENAEGEPARLNSASTSNSASSSDRTSPASENSQLSEASLQRSDEGDRSLIASALVQLPDSLKALMQRWAIALAYNPKGTDDNSAKIARDKWTDKINSQASRRSIGRLEPDSMKDFARLSYPIEVSMRDREQSFRVCLEQPPGPVEIGVLFDSQSEIVGKPELIRSSGYSAVNDEAIALVESAEQLPNNRISKAFVLEIPVDYDKQSCVRLSDVKN